MVEEMTSKMMWGGTHVDFLACYIPFVLVIIEIADGDGPHES